MPKAARLRTASEPPLDLSQVFLYERGGQTFSLPAKAASAAILLGAAVGAGLAAARPARLLGWLAGNLPRALGTLL